MHTMNDIDIINKGLQYVNNQKVISHVNSSGDIKDILLRNLESVKKDGFFILNSCFHRSTLLAEQIKEYFQGYFVVDVHQPHKVGYGNNKTVHFALELQSRMGLLYVEYKNGQYFIGNGEYPSNENNHMIERIELKDIEPNVSLENIAKKLTHIDLSGEIQFDERVELLYRAYEYLSKTGKAFDGTEKYTLLNPQTTILL